MPTAQGTFGKVDPDSPGLNVVFVQWHHRQHGHVAKCEIHQWLSPGAWLAKVHVPEEVRGTGMGENMVRAVLEYCEKHRKEAIGLSCLISNTAALALYKKCGFRIVGYGKDTDRYILVKTFSYGTE